MRFFSLHENMIANNDAPPHKSNKAIPCQLILISRTGGASVNHPQIRFSKDKSMSPIRRQFPRGEKKKRGGRR
jgi:hypothetical protein